MTRHLIAGAGPAGMNAIETIRALDSSAELTLVCDEPAYSRMVLPYYVAGQIQESAVHTADDAWFDDLRVDARIGRRLDRVDPDARRATLDDGSLLDFDTLLLATGSRVRRPAVDGLEGPGVLDLWTLDDARSFLAGPRAEIVVVGAGFIGFVILDALVHSGARLTYVEIEPQVLPHMLDATAAELLAAHLADRGVEVRTGERLEAIEQAGGRRRLRLAGGDVLECDAVILATGVAPNVDYVDGGGIEIERGIRVDDHLRCHPSVYAAGDVAQGPELLSGGSAVHAIQPTAVDHGRVAGANMAGLDVRYAGSLVMNVLHTQELESCSFGLWQDEERETTEVRNSSNRIYRKYVWDDDRLVGGMLVGPTLAVSGVNDPGMLKGLIQSGVSLGRWKTYLHENPLDLRRAYVASGAATELLGSTLLAGRAEVGGGYRLPKVPARRPRSAHHATLFTGAS